jgi:hypothetical protein
MENRKPILSVRIDGELLARIDALCERTGVGRAEIVERCIVVGLDDEEEFVKWLESPIKGPVMNALLHPKVLNMLFKLVPGYGVDETQQKVRKNVREKRKGGPKGSPATS